MPQFYYPGRGVITAKTMRQADRIVFNKGPHNRKLKKKLRKQGKKNSRRGN